jgi:hypothetical protein
VLSKLGTGKLASASKVGAGWFVFSCWRVKVASGRGCRRAPVFLVPPAFLYRAKVKYGAVLVLFYAKSHFRFSVTLNTKIPAPVVSISNGYARF